MEALEERELHRSVGLDAAEHDGARIGVVDREVGGNYRLTDLHVIVEEEHDWSARELDPLVSCGSSARVGLSLDDEQGEAGARDEAQRGILARPVVDNDDFDALDGLRAELLHEPHDGRRPIVRGDDDGHTGRQEPPLFTNILTVARARVFWKMGTTAAFGAELARIAPMKRSGPISRWPAWPRRSASRPYAPP